MNIQDVFELANQRTESKIIQSELNDLIVAYHNDEDIGGSGDDFLLDLLERTYVKGFISGAIHIGFGDSSV